MTSPHVHVPFEKIEHYIDLIRQNRLNLEIYFSSDSLDILGNDQLKSVMGLLDYMPSLSFHAPFMDLSPAAVDRQVRQATISRFNQVLDIAEIMNPLAIVFHSGYEKWKYNLSTDLWLAKSLETWYPLNRRAQSLGCKVAIENIFEDEPTNLRMLMEKMSSDNFGICFDTGHCNLFSIVPIAEWMEQIGTYIIELHLHDNNRSGDQHYPIGEGTFDFNKLFSLLGNKNCIHTIEAHTPERVIKSMDQLKKYTRQA
ncbi:MAG TPA: sugar phosphate isomerase/epimerase family protein [Dissulfurispiraceae bacterium]|nr:sugar phosphate isomerase/epimerase family protein [Dissulfurispiraceae bacterium]